MAIATWQVETKENGDYRLEVEVHPDGDEGWSQEMYRWRGDIFISTQGRIHLNEMKLEEPASDVETAMSRTLPLIAMAMQEGRADEEILEHIAGTCLSAASNHEEDLRRVQESRTRTLHNLAELTKAGPRALTQGN